MKMAVKVTTELARLEHTAVCRYNTSAQGAVVLPDDGITEKICIGQRTHNQPEKAE